MLFPSGWASSFPPSWSERKCPDSHLLPGFHSCSFPVGFDKARTADVSRDSVWSLLSLARERKTLTSPWLVAPTAEKVSLIAWACLNWVLPLTSGMGLDSWLNGAEPHFPVCQTG